jgi:O-acetyl-ADP-ribose deacetylase (regulator of RNase III)
MINEINANLLEYQCDGIIHQANCFHTMGGGIALRIKNKWKEAYAADVAYMPSGDKSKLGRFSVAVLPSNFHIFNLYGQYTFGSGRQTSYDALTDGLQDIEQYAFDNGLRELALPNRMGCVLGGGNWLVVRAIIETVFGKNEDVNLTICNYEG